MFDGHRRSSFLPHTRIEHNINNIGQEIGTQHDQSNQQENRLHQRVILRLHRAQQDEADARIGENNLGQQSAADDKA